MVITIGSEIICDGPDRSVDKNAGPADLTIVSPTAKQIVEYLRAEDVTVFDRGNRRNEISFSVKRQLVSVAAAETYCWLYPTSLTRSGTLVMTNGGQSARLLTAVLDVVCRHVGCTVLLSYSIVGGKLEAV